MVGFYIFYKVCFKTSVKVKKVTKTVDFINSSQTLVCFHIHHKNSSLFLMHDLEKIKNLNQGCALSKISGSPSGSQTFYLSCPGLKVGRPAKNFGEPFRLPSIPAGVPRPLKLVARVHVMRKYFVRTRILLAC